MNATGNRWCKPRRTGRRRDWEGRTGCNAISRSIPGDGRTQFSQSVLERVLLIGTHLSGRHYGQRPICAAQTGRTHGRTDQPRTTSNNPCQRRAVHTWLLREVPALLIDVRSTPDTRHSGADFRIWSDYVCFSPNAGPIHPVDQRRARGARAVPLGGYRGGRKDVYDRGGRRDHRGRAADLADHFTARAGVVLGGLAVAVNRPWPLPWGTHTRSFL